MTEEKLKKNLKNELEKQLGKEVNEIALNAYFLAYKKEYEKMIEEKMTTHEIALTMQKLSQIAHNTFVSIAMMKQDLIMLKKIKKASQILGTELSVYNPEENIKQNVTKSTEVIYLPPVDKKEKTK